MRTIVSSVVCLGPWAACTVEDIAVDTDGDGLNDALEIAMGSDPEDTDTDDDGLLDGEEVALGTSLSDPDSDADGYTDRDEVHEGKDPLDPSSVIYQGGWPYSFEKTELKGGHVYAVGKRFANLQLQDQFGDVVSLWDFYDDDKYVIVDLCGAWCPICIDLGLWISGERDGSVFDPWLDVAEAVDAGELSWISVLFMDELGEPPTGEDAVRYAEGVPHPLVPVLADSEQESVEFVQLSVVPTLILLSPDLKVHTAGDDYRAALDAALEILEE